MNESTFLNSSAVSDEVFLEENDETSSGISTRSAAAAAHYQRNQAQVHEIAQHVFQIVITVPELTKNFHLMSVHWFAV